MVIAVDMYISHMNDYPLIHSHLPPTFNKKDILYTKFYVTLHVNMNHICNKYVTYYIYIYLEHPLYVGF